MRTWRDDRYEMTKPPERPESPVTGMPAWADEDLEQWCRAELPRWFRDVPEDDLEDAVGRIEVALAGVVDALAALADIDADWRSGNRPWFRWGLAEIDAERAAVKAYRQLLEQSKGRLNRKIRDRNRRRNESDRAAAIDARRSEKTERQARPRKGSGTAAAVEADDVLVQLRKDALGAAHELAGAPAEEWGPDTPLGLRLRAALAAYEARLRAVRAEAKVDTRPMYDHPALWEVCDACNFVKHRCHFCGDDLRHDERTNFDGTLHGCYADYAEEAEA